MKLQRIVLHLGINIILIIERLIIKKYFIYYTKIYFRKCLTVFEIFVNIFIRKLLRIRYICWDKTCFCLDMPNNILNFYPVTLLFRLMWRSFGDECSQFPGFKVLPEARICHIGFSL